MEHLSFEIICRIADGEIKQNKMAMELAHWKSCRSCQQQIELQRSLMKGIRQSTLIIPSKNFTQNVLDEIIPSQKKKWYEWILHNMGNIIAMTSVLALLGYVFSLTENSSIQNTTPTKFEPIFGIFKIIQDNSHSLGNYLAQKILIQGINTIHPHPTVFALLAIIILVFIDQIAGHFFRQLKA